MSSGRAMERPDIIVISRILEQLWKCSGPILKTRLQLAANLNYDILLKYLDWMQERGLVSFVMNDDHEAVAITPKGQEAYRQLVYLLRDLLAMKAK
jgi:predicted transcriptional regulator